MGFRFRWGELLDLCVPQVPLHNMESQLKKIVLIALRQGDSLNSPVCSTLNPKIKDGNFHSRVNFSLERLLPSPWASFGSEGPVSPDAVGLGAGCAKCKAASLCAFPKLLNAAGTAQGLHWVLGLSLI
uniref:Uncharacterized protein n=1 Tax=Macaca fascicularis TaxID=9541 RepID=Q9BGT0_MACFA|nr:hypothetical protein [Macaca fascicularis]